MGGSPHRAQTREEGGQSGKRHAIHGKEEARRERDVTETTSSGSWRNGLCCRTVGAGSGNEPDPHVSQSDESHAKSRCEQQEGDSTHHSTREVALCVSGKRGNGEKKRSIAVRESKRESRREARQLRGSCTTQRGLVQCKLQNLTGQSGGASPRQLGTSAGGLHRRGRAPLTPPTGAVGGAEAHRTVGMRRKSNLQHDMRGGRQDEREDGLRKGGGEDTVTVTMRVTASRGAERGHRRRAATRAKPDRRGREGAGTWPALHDWEWEGGEAAARAMR